MLFFSNVLCCDIDILLLVYYLLFFSGAQACVLAYSTTDRASFDAVDSWRKKVEAEVGEIPMVLVQNKIDLVTDIAVTE